MFHVEHFRVTDVSSGYSHFVEITGKRWHRVAAKLQIYSTYY
jgi:hypothetical protein